jgi:DNA-binding response OmpR family regulator
MSLRVLALADRAEILNLIRTTLEPAGCNVQSFASTDEAADFLEREKFDGFFLSPSPLDPNAFELVRKVRAHELNKTVPIILLTGGEDVETMRRGFQAGVTCYLGEPITPERILAVIRAIRGSMLQEKRRYVRLPFRTSVNCNWGAERNGRFRATSIEIGEGGMMLEPTGGMEPGQEVELEFSPPQLNKPRRVRARVVRKIEPNRLGLMFHELPTDARQAIQRYINAEVRV